MRLFALGLIVVVIAGCGSAARARDESVATPTPMWDDGPGFPPAAGWHTARTGATAPPQAPAAVTATVDLVEPPGDNPRVTAASLGPDDVLITVIDHGVAQHNWEGGEGLRYAITAQLNGRMVDTNVYFGAAPTAATRELANERLAQLGI